jgi:hypothetical protein
MPFPYTMKLQLLYNIYPACMKIVFTICFFIFSLQVFSHTLITGSGTGSVIQNEMNGLKPGDTLAIRSGFYEKGGSFSNLTGITIINYQGIVDFGRTVSLEILNLFLFPVQAGKEKPTAFVSAISGVMHFIFRPDVVFSLYLIANTETLTGLLLMQAAFLFHIPVIPPHLPSTKLHLFIRNWFIPDLSLPEAGQQTRSFKM